MTNLSDRLAQRIGGHYDYSPWHRCLEIVATAACLACLAMLSWRIVDAMWAAVGGADFDWMTLASAVGASLGGYVAADLVSGLVHWLADRFGSPETPIVGEAFVRPFREHHDYPTEITEHDFIEVNGNNSLVLLLFLVPLYIVLPVQLTVGWVAVAGFSWSFALAIFMTNQFHKWAHTARPPRVAVWLQRRGLILSKKVHDRHHTIPYESDYCITSGWLNGILNRTHLFGRIESLLNHEPPASTPEVGSRR